MLKRLSLILTLSLLMSSAFAFSYCPKGSTFKQQRFQKVIKHVGIANNQTHKAWSDWGVKQHAVYANGMKWHLIVGISLLTKQQALLAATSALSQLHFTGKQKTAVDNRPIQIRGLKPLKQVCHYRIGKYNAIVVRYWR